MYPTKFRKNSFNLKTFFVNGSKYCICTKFLIQSLQCFLANEEKEINSYYLPIIYKNY